MERAVCFFLVLSSNIMQNIYKLFNKNNDATTLWSNIKLHQQKHVFSSKERYDNATSNYQACSRINHIKLRKWNNKSELSRT